MLLRENPNLASDTTLPVNFNDELSAHGTGRKLLLQATNMPCNGFPKTQSEVSAGEQDCAGGLFIFEGTEGLDWDGRKFPDRAGCAFLDRMRKAGLGFLRR
jgi:hypothetical protein